MSSFDPTFDAAVQQPFIRGFVAVQIIFPDHTLQVMTGSGFCSFAGMTFTGVDPVFGTIGNISSLSSAFTTASPSFDFTLCPPTSTGFAQLNNPAYQGSIVNVWMGVINDLTGQVVGVPYFMFYGMVDYAKSNVDQQNQAVVIRVNTGWDRMFIAEEASRQNAQYWQTVFSTSDFYTFNIQAIAPNFWGQSAPSNPQFPAVAIAPTLGDRLSGQNKGGYTSGTTYPGIGT